MFIQPSIDTHLGCIHLLAILPHVAMNMGMPIAPGVPAFNSFEVYTQNWDWWIKW